MTGVHLVGSGIPTLLPTHGVGTRTDLPVPTPLTLAAAGGAVLISFLVLTLFWRRPRTRKDAGPALPAAVDALVGSVVLRTALRAVTLGVLVGVVVLGFAGPTDTNRNLGPWLIYVWLWVGLVPASVLLGPVWAVLNPLRLAHAVVARLLRLDPADGVRPLPAEVGRWPAAVFLAGYLWVELVLPTRADPPVLAGLIAGYCLVQIGLGCVFGSSWFAGGDVFEAYSRVIGSMAPIGRRDGRLALRNPLDGLDDLDAGPGLVALLVVLIGGTAFDGLSRTSFWQSAGATGPLDGTVGLALAILLIAVIFLLGTASTVATTARDTRRHPPAAFAHALVPIAVGYAVAHYFSLLVFDGQQVAILASDPLDHGSDWFGTATHVIDYTLVGTNTIAVVQVLAIVVGHLVATVAAHDRATRLYPDRAAVRTQYPMLATMVALTIGAVALIGAP
ncbi:hypothetical protein LQ327_17445 [Actinomycetospora endophytica]|uniref:Fenitrothion hydrolase n=1 Tax=Actinomycetospora endophytica TaxID=2291215 RepID=A0ABS8PCC8_9PSEU|nr:hypothetical protein [Actinomycetospora endophytica]MCD2195155.1 hypothetical protein [Actinomycetospora endophytica]